MSNHLTPFDPREGNHLRTAIVDSVTHELRTPLTSVSSGCSWCVPSKPSTRLLAALHARVSIRIPANHQAHHVGGCYAHAAAACVRPTELRECCNQHTSHS